MLQARQGPVNTYPQHDMPNWWLQHQSQLIMSSSLQLCMHSPCKESFKCSSSRVPVRPSVARSSLLTQSGRASVLYCAPSTRQQARRSEHRELKHSQRQSRLQRNFQSRHQCTAQHVPPAWHRAIEQEDLITHTLPVGICMTVSKTQGSHGLGELTSTELSDLRQDACAGHVQVRGNTLSLGQHATLDTSVCRSTDSHCSLP